MVRIAYTLRVPATAHAERSVMNGNTKRDAEIFQDNGHFKIGNQFR